MGQRDARNYSGRVQESGSLWVVSEEGLALTRTGVPPLLHSRGSTNVREGQSLWGWTASNVWGEGAGQTAEMSLGS